MSGRIRSIKPEWLEDERLVMASEAARTLSVALVVLADDQGRGRFVPAVLSARIFPRDPRIFSWAFSELSETHFVQVYEVDAQRYWQIRNWAKHQRVDKPAKPRIPEPLDDQFIKSQDFFLGNPGTSRLIPIPIPIPTSDQDPDPDQDPIAIAPKKIADEAEAEIAIRSEAKPRKPKTPSAPGAEAPGYTEAVDLWFFEYERYYHQKPVWNAVQGKKLKALLTQADIEELRTLVPAFFRWRRPEVIRQGHSLWKGFASLTAKLDELRADLANPERRAFAADAEHVEKQEDLRGAMVASGARVLKELQEERNGKLGIVGTTGPERGEINAGDNKSLRYIQQETIARSHETLGQAIAPIRQR